MVPLNISFRRGLVGNNLALWYMLLARVAYTRLNGERDKFVWGLLQSGLFSMSSMYKALILDTRVRDNSVLRKMKVPLRIKIFVWYLKWGVVLTKDNLVRQNRNENKSCVFCLNPKSIQHLFFDCHLARFIWRAVQVTFNNDIPMSVPHLFNGWVTDLGVQFKKLALVGATTLCWALWTSRIDMVFDFSLMKTYMQVFYRGTYKLHLWVQLQKHEELTKQLWTPVEPWSRR
jgi:hypothetical protein